MDFNLHVLNNTLRYVEKTWTFVSSKLQRQYWGYSVLKSLGIEPKKEDFRALYLATIYNLIHEKRKKRSIIRLFEIKEVQDAFEKELYEKNNWAFSVAFEDHLHTNPAFRGLKHVKISIDKELSDFRDEFIRQIGGSRTPKELETHQNIEAIRERMQTLVPRVDSMNPELGGVEIEGQLKFMSNDIAPLVQHLSRRSLVVDDIFSVFEKKEIVFMTGSISTGKTQLSLLIFEKHPGAKSWLSLKGTYSKTVFEKISLLQGDLVKDESLTTSSQPWRLIVLDDLPRLDKANQHLPQLANFFLKCSKKRIRLLITSNYNLPSQFLDLIPKATIERRTIPFLTTEETAEVLNAYGAADQEIEQFKNIVRVISHGHPTITSAICKFLGSAGWKMDLEKLKNLFKGDYSVELTEETYSDIVSTIEDDETRELLHRLNLIKNAFTRTQVTMVAEIVPTIPSPLEKFNSIIGLWAQRMSGETYELSPLVQRLKGENLNAIVKRRINITLGLEILAKKKLSQFEAQHAITYFIAGGAVDHAGFVLTVALNGALTTPEIFYDWGFDLYWTSMELPVEMETGTKLLIRILQLMLFIKRESEHAQQISFVRSDLEKILLSANLDASNYAFASLFLSTLYAKENSSKSLKYFASGVQFFEASGQAELRKELEDQYKPEQLIWVSTRSIETEKQIDEWFNTFKAMSSERQAKAIALPEIRMGTAFITENLITSEYRKEDSARDWNKLVSVLEKIKARATALSIPLLAARAIKCIIQITSEQLNNIDAAKEMGDKALEIYSNENRSARFLISDAIGRQLFYNGKIEDSKTYVAEAIAMDVEDFYTEKLDTCLVMSQLLGDKDVVSAHHYIEKAQQLVQDKFVFTDTLRLKIGAEYAISLAFLNRINEAIYQLETGYDTIFSKGIDLPEFQVLTLRYVHVLNYWFNIHLKKKQPNDIDGEPYEKPFRGYFFRRYTDAFIEKNWMEERSFIGAHMFISVFEELGDIAMATKWAELSTRLNKSMTNNAFGSIAMLAVPYFVLNDKYDEAIECQVQSLEQYNSMGDPLAAIKNERIKRAFKDAPPRNTIQEYDDYIVVVILPIVLRLLRLRLDGHPDTGIMLRKAIAATERWKSAFTYRDGIEKIIELLTDWEAERIDGAALAEVLQNYAGSQEDSVKTTGYLIASTLTVTPKSFYLQAALICTLEQTMIKSGYTNYKFLLLPFLEAFWFGRIQSHPNDFEQLTFWAQTSIPFYKAAKEDKKAKTMFKILGHHIKGIKVPAKLEDWIEG